MSRGYGRQRSEAVGMPCTRQAPLPHVEGVPACTVDSLSMDLHTEMDYDYRFPHCGQKEEVHQGGTAQPMN